MRVLQVAGPRAVGTSTVAWGLYRGVVGAGVTAGYVDLAQIAFHRPAPSAAVTAANLAALRQVHADAGATVLVVAGRSAFPVPDATTCWLHASRESLVARLLARGRGEGPAIPGDDLRGRPAAELRALAEEVPVPVVDVVASAEGRGGIVVDTDGRTAAEVIETVRARVGFPG